MLGDVARKAREKREAKQRAQLLRQVEIIEKLLATLSPKEAREPVYRLLREVLSIIRASLTKISEQS